MSRKSPRISRLLLGLLAAGLSVSALAQSTEFPTYAPGENTSATTGPTYSQPLANPWVVSDGTIITPVGAQVYLGTTTRAKDIAINPMPLASGDYPAAVLQMGAPHPVTVFDVKTGAILSTYEFDAASSTNYDNDGSQGGIAFTPDGLHLLFSQDGSYGPGGSFVTIANFNLTTGVLTDDVQVSVPIDVNSESQLTNVTCYTSTGYNSYGLPTGPPSAGVSPPGTTGSFAIPCGYPYSIFSDDTFTSYPTSVAISADGNTAYAVLMNNDTLAKITGLTGTPAEAAQVRVGNVPHSVIISADGKTAYVSNEAGRVATADDFQEYSNGTPVVARYPEGSTSTGTVSVVDLTSFKVTGSISTGLHPTGMALWNNYLLVANTYSDSISVIDTTMNKVVRTINLGLPILVPGDHGPAGLGPNSIAVDQKNNTAYVALHNANAIAVVDLNNSWEPIQGMIPTGYAPSSVVLDSKDNELLVANDKGIGTTGYGVAPPPTKTYENSYQKEFDVTYFGTHQDLGTVSIVPVPKYDALVGMTRQVVQNNHWDLAQNIESASGGNPWTKPVAIPAKIGDPSLIKHVFVIIRENRTYDQILGDVTEGNGDATLAVFGDHSTYAMYPVVTPNAHTLVERFPLLDNFYDPSRQSADGHNWITQAMAPYDDDIQSPDWLRDYPSNGGDAIAYQKKGHLWDAAAAAGIKVKNYGEYVEYNTFTVPGCTPTNLTQSNSYNGPGKAVALPFVVSDSCEPSWTQFYNDTLLYEAGKETQLQYYNTISSYTPLPTLYKDTVQNYPQFDLGIPDQYRVDVWQQDFNKDVAVGKVPQLEFLWIMQDHTTGPPNATAEQADNDLAVGRVIDIISHSSVWKDSAIFVEEDDAQDGVDHVDGHRSPGYVVSPYVKQQVNADGAGAVADSTFYTQVNMTRTIEQILGLKPMNQNDLVASPMRTLFVDNPPQDNFLPWAHVPNQVPLCYGVAGWEITSGNSCVISPTAVSFKNDSPAVKALRAAWMQEKAQVFAPKYHIPDSLDPNLVTHFDWYEATGFKVPFPGEKRVLWPSEFKTKAPAKADLDD